MNAAEITDKLGLHSLRQRAWVCTLSHLVRLRLTHCHSTSSPHAPHRATVFTKDWNGSATRFAKLATTKRPLPDTCLVRLSTPFQLSQQSQQERCLAASTCDTSSSPLSCECSSCYATFCIVLGCQWSKFGSYTIAVCWHALASRAACSVTLPAKQGLPATNHRSH